MVIHQFQLLSNLRYDIKIDLIFMLKYKKLKIIDNAISNSSVMNSNIHKISLSINPFISKTKMNTVIFHHCYFANDNSLSITRTNYIDHSTLQTCISGYASTPEFSIY